MKASLLIVVLGGAFALSACNSTSATKPTALQPEAATKRAVAGNEDYRKLGGVHAHHTPEQHAAFLKRVGQLPTDDEAEVSGGGGGGHHH